MGIVNGGNGLLLIPNIAFHLTGGKGNYLKKKERALVQLYCCQ